MFLRARPLLAAALSGVMALSATAHAPACEPPPLAEPDVLAFEIWLSRQNPLDLGHDVACLYIAKRELLVDGMRNADSHLACAPLVAAERTVEWPLDRWLLRLSWSGALGLSAATNLASFAVGFLL